MSQPLENRTGSATRCCFGGWLEADDPLRRDRAYWSARGWLRRGPVIYMIIIHLPNRESSSMPPSLFVRKAVLLRIHLDGSIRTTVLHDLTAENSLPLRSSADRSSIAMLAKASNPTPARPVGRLFILCFHLHSIASLSYFSFRFTIFHTLVLYF